MARGRYETALLAMFKELGTDDDKVKAALRDLASQADDAATELERDYRSLAERCTRDANRVAAGLSDDGALNSSVVSDIRKNSVKLQLQARTLVCFISANYGQRAVELFRETVDASRKA